MADPPTTIPTVNLDALRRLAIDQALTASSGNITHAAIALGISRRTLRRSMVAVINDVRRNGES